MPRRKLSLRYELATLRGALDAARILSGELSTMQFATKEDRNQAPLGVESILVLVGERLRTLGHAISGDVDPGLLIARHNQVDDESNATGAYDDLDIYLSAWTGKGGSKPEQ